MAYYCWECYGRNDRQAGVCVHCGGEIAPPDTTTEVERLEWGARHPDPDIAIIATRRLGQVGDALTVAFLRALIAHPPDPYVAAEAVRSLLILSDAVAEHDLLVTIAHDGPVPAARVARDALMALEEGSRTDSSSESPKARRYRSAP